MTHVRILALFLCVLCLCSSSIPSFAAAPKEREHLIFWKGTAQEFEVYRIYGREEGPTVMIIGGIQGDEPGGFLSADSYTDVSLKRGNLIIVPRANFKSVIQRHRGPEGDMNRKFDGYAGDDQERKIVEVLKGLMMESDLMLNLHDGSGYYRPTWESDMANPNRYGQCIIADAGVYIHPATGRVVELEKYALEVVRRVNLEIETPLYKFHFFNMMTVDDDTKYIEQRKSASYYALAQVGIPAFGVETSKQLPSLEMKVYQHNLAVNAFLDLFGVELEQPRFSLEKPELGYAIISVNGKFPLAVAEKQTLQVAKGDTIEVVHVSANHDRGISVEIQGSGGMNDLHRPFVVTGPVTVLVRKENTVFAAINVELLPDGEKGMSPQLLGEAKARPPRFPVEATPELLAALNPGEFGLSGEGAASALTAGTGEKPGISTASGDMQAASSTGGGRAQSASEASADTGHGQASSLGASASGAAGVTGFLVEVDGRAVEIKPGTQLVVPYGASLKIVDLKSTDPLPEGTVMNLRGFVPRGNEALNTGEDRGATANTATDMMQRFSEGGKGEVYPINAELGKKVLASCSIKIVRPVLESVTVLMAGQEKVLRLGSRTLIPVGAKVELLSVSLKGDLELQNPRFTLAGHAFPANLPQTLTMRDIAINLAVFDGEVLMGKITWVPKKP